MIFVHKVRRWIWHARQGWGTRQRTWVAFSQRGSWVTRRKPRLQTGPGGVRKRALRCRVGINGTRELVWGPQFWPSRRVKESLYILQGPEPAIVLEWRSWSRQKRWQGCQMKDAQSVLPWRASGKWKGATRRGETAYFVSCFQLETCGSTFILHTKCWIYNPDRFMEKCTSSEWVQMQTWYVSCQEQGICCSKAGYFPLTLETTKGQVGKVWKGDYKPQNELL